MKIKSIHILGFGKFTDFSLDFSDGANLVYGRNEDGKTTIMAFIKMMFYGTTTKQSETFKNPRKRYKPLAEGTFGGNIVFSHDGVNYRLEREFKGSNSTDKITLYNLDRLSPVALKGADVGSEFFSLSADAFEKSVFIGNIGYEDISGAGGEINSKLANISLTGDEDISFDLIKKRLDNFRGIYTTPRKVGALDAIKKQTATLNQELYNALEDQKQRQAIGKRLEELTAQKKSLTAKLKEYNTALEGFKAYKRLEQLKQKVDALDTCKEYKDKIAALEKELCVNGQIPSKEDLDLCFSKLAVLDSLNLRLEELESKTPTVTTDINLELDNKLAELKQIEDKLLSLSLPAKKSGFKPLLLFLFAILCAVSALGVIKNYLFIIPAVIFAAAFLVLLLLNIKDKGKNKSYILELTAKKTELYNAVQDLRLKKLEGEHDLTAEAESIKARAGAEFKKAVDVLSKFTDQAITDAEQARLVAENINKKLAILTELNTKLSALSTLVDGEQTQSARNEFEQLIALNLLPATDQDINYAKEKAEQTTKEISSVNEQIANLNGVLSSSFSNKPDAAQIENEIARLAQTNNHYEKLVSATDIALQALNDAYSNLRGSFGGALNGKVSEILSGLTDGKYKNVGVSDSLCVSLDNGILTDARQFSSGTLDQAYFALRLGVAELISEDLGGLPLLLDDAFLQYDDERMKNGFRFLADYKGQSVMFTCRKEFAEFAKTLEGTNIINL